MNKICKQCRRTFKGRKERFFCSRICQRVCPDWRANIKSALIDQFLGGRKVWNKGRIWQRCSGKTDIAFDTRELQRRFTGLVRSDLRRRLKLTELRIHLENLWTTGMSWSNYGRSKGEWSVDHVQPVSSFVPMSSLDEVNSLTNLQPMWASENSSKSNRGG
jgi:hypothetical protein